MNRPKADRERLRLAILKLTKREPHLSPQAIGKRLNASHVTVRKVQRAAGVYTARGAAGLVAK